MTVWVPAVEYNDGTSDCVPSDVYVENVNPYMLALPALIWVPAGLTSEITTAGSPATASIVSPPALVASITRFVCTGVGPIGSATAWLYRPTKETLED